MWNTTDYIRTTQTAVTERRNKLIWSVKKGDPTLHSAETGHTVNIKNTQTVVSITHYTTKNMRRIGNQQKAVLPIQKR